MSSYYTAAELEAMRKARIKQELADSIRDLQNQIQTGTENKVHVSLGAHIVVSVSIPDEVMSGTSANSSVSEESLVIETKVEEHTDELDFSSLLFAQTRKPTKLESELEKWIKKVDERPIIAERDAQDRKRLLSELSKISSDASIDIEDKLRLIKLRVNAYLQGSAHLSAIDIDRIQERYCEYCALCELVGVKPKEVLPYRVEQEITRLTSILQKQKEDEYIMDVINSIMEELGCHVKEEAVLDHTIGQVYSVDEHPLCDVFVGREGNGIMFEPIAEAEIESLETQRNTERSANSICSLYSVLEEKAAEKGVILKRVYIEPVKIGEMCTQSDISGRKQAQKRKKNTSSKLRALKSEV